MGAKAAESPSGLGIEPVGFEAGVRRYASSKTAINSKITSIAVATTRTIVR